MVEVVMRMILFFLLVCFSSAKATKQECSFGVNGINLISSESQNHFLYEIKDHPKLWSKNLTKSQNYLSYRNYISSNFNINPLKISREQLPIFANSKIARMKREGRNIISVLDKGVGTIRQINCLESLLFEQQSYQKSLIDHPNEFIAYIMRKKIGRSFRLKVYISTSDTDYQKPKLDLIKSDIENGWSFHSLIHNHPFHIDKYPNGMYQGGIVPSLSDVDFGRMNRDNNGLKYFIVTNGFHTISLQGSDLDKLIGHED